MHFVILLFRFHYLPPGGVSLSTLLRWRRNWYWQKGRWPICKLKSMTRNLCFKICFLLPRNLKEGIRSLRTPVLTLCGLTDRYVWRRVIFPLDLARSFGAIYAHRYHVIHCTISYMRAWFKSTQERQLTLNKNFVAGLAMQKIRRYSKSPPYVMARWPPQQILPFKFPWLLHNFQDKVQSCIHFHLSNWSCNWYNNICCITSNL